MGAVFGGVIADILGATIYITERPSIEQDQRKYYDTGVILGAVALLVVAVRLGQLSDRGASLTNVLTLGCFGRRLASNTDDEKLLQVTSSDFQSSRHYYWLNASRQ